MPSDPSPIMVRQMLGAALRDARRTAGLLQEQVAESLQVSQDRMSRVETGKQWPTESQLSQLIALYKVDQRARGHLEGLYSAGRSLETKWWMHAKFRGVFEEGTSFFMYEDAAQKISISSGTTIPGCLQTRDYITALSDFYHVDQSLEYRELFLEMRLLRRDIISRRTPVAYDALIQEAALRTVVGGVRVLAEQLDHLLAAVQRSNVTLRVLPFAAGAAAVTGSISSIFDFPGDTPSILYQEQTTGGDYEDRPAHVRKARRRFERLQEHALSQSETIRLIERIRKEL
ncbi:helix-turn-helix domain-containing protein [Streptacidiphilus sp. 4-A2]|nr:helix-turn-helix domain-containing protein [Streptacidiphilus sp. 4-A2]